MDIRKLTREDAGAFRMARLQALRESAEGYLGSLQEEESLSTDQMAARIFSDAEPPEHFVFGAFMEDQLVGTCGFKREATLKMRHKGKLWAVYIAREGRGKGIGKDMVGAVLKEAKALHGLEQINIEVSGEAAKRFYIRLGFKEFGLEQRGMKIGQRYVDLEHMMLLL